MFVPFLFMHSNIVFADLGFKSGFFENAAWNIKYFHPDFPGSQCTALNYLKLFYAQWIFKFLKTVFAFNFIVYRNFKKQLRIRNWHQEMLFWLKTNCVEFDLRINDFELQENECDVKSVNEMYKTVL